MLACRIPDKSAIDSRASSLACSVSMVLAKVPIGSFECPFCNYQHVEFLICCRNKTDFSLRVAARNAGSVQDSQRRHWQYDQ